MPVNFRAIREISISQQPKAVRANLIRIRNDLGGLLGQMFSQ